MLDLARGICNKQATVDVIKTFIETHKDLVTYNSQMHGGR